MFVIPELNLNKHPKDVKNGSLVDAINMQIDKDSALLTTENSIRYNEELEDKISECLGNDNFKIVYAIPCNTEIVFFIAVEDNTSELQLVRYNEQKDACKLGPVIDYSGGKFTGTFTYNLNELIISFSEYDGEENVPLKVINLKDFEHTSRDDKFLHPIVPEVIIPTMTHSYSKGNSYKGWYTVFIRYKISENNYTQWYNINKSIFVDEYKETYIEDYWLSYKNSDKNVSNPPKFYRAYTTKDISLSFDNCNITFNLSINRLDSRYKNYQLGFVNQYNNKLTGLRTQDMDINTINYTFIASNIIIEDAEQFINTYYNYFDVKTIGAVSNVLYIGNYKEKELENNIDLSNLKINIRKKNINNEFEDSDGYNTNSKIPILIKARHRDDITKVFQIRGFTYQGMNFIDATQFIVNQGDGHKVSNLANNSVYTLGVAGFDINNIFQTFNDLYVEEIFPTSIWFRIDEVAYDEPTLYVFTDNNITGKCQKYTYRAAFGSNNSLSVFECAGLYKVHSNMSPFTNPIFKLSPTLIEYKYEVVKELIDKEYNDNIKILNSATLDKDNLYSMFIHFVDKYGISTRGFNIAEHDVCYSSAAIKDSNYFSFLYNDIRITAENIPDNYIGYFFSYEKPLETINYKGIFRVSSEANTNIIEFISDILFIDSKSTKNIKLNFDRVKLAFVDVDINEGYLKGPVNIDVDISKLDFKHFNIKNKSIYYPDTYNNIAKSGHIKIELDDVLTLDKKPWKGYHYGICYLYKSSEYILNNVNKLENKILIPCSEVSYVSDINKYVDLNFNNAFLTKHTNLAFSDNIVYNNTTKTFNYLANIKSSDYQYSIIGENAFNTPVVVPYINIVFEDYNFLPYESFIINNKPQVMFFTDDPEEDTKKARFYSGNIVEIKDTIDLYGLPIGAYYDEYPKTLFNYNPNDTFINIFDKTIRRSNVIQDESFAINWRNFEVNNYKNITENKGSIIKLYSVGNIMLVHTEHSLFQFNADSSLKTSDGTNVSLGNFDVWDIPYKEVFTSELGFAGINKNEHAIGGQFGYIFYEEDKRRFFRYDNNQIKQIDLTINNYIRSLPKDINVEFIVDEYRDRLLISISNDKFIELLSYNYKFGVFVSLHEYIIYKGYNTKNRLYLIGENNSLCEYNNNSYNDYIWSDTCKVSILINTEYELVKFLEYITYKFNKITIKTTKGVPENIRDSFYSGDKLIVNSESCNTGQINIFVEDAVNTVNRLSDYDKPYRDLGKWNVNLIRDNIKEYLNGKDVSDNMTRMYGNWFKVTFIFNNTNDCVEIESIDYKLSPQ